MDKTKDAPIPERSTPPPSKEGAQKSTEPERKSASEPQFVRGTIDPPTKK